MILNYINIKILVCLHVLNVQLHLILYLILMWPILYPDFHNHTSLLAIQLNLYSWLQFSVLHGKILFHQKFLKTSLHCVLLISLMYLENQSVTGLFLKGSIQWQLKTLVFKTLVLSHIRLNSIFCQFSKIEIKVTSSTVSILLC